MKNKKSVLIIGGFGFLGKSLAEYFSKFLDFDVSVVGKHEPTISYDIVINCGGKIHNSTYSELIQSNTSDPMKYLFEYHRLNKNVVYLHLGSSSEYGTQTTKLSENNTQCCPKTEYAVTKYVGSLGVLQAASILECKANIIRPFSVFGKHDNQDKFIPKIIRSIKNNDSIKLYPGSHDWIYADDFCELCRLVVLSDCSGEIINAGTGICLTNKQVVNDVFDILNKKVDITEINELYRIYDTDYWAADISKAQTLFNWTPKYTFKDGINDLTSK